MGDGSYKTKAVTQGARKPPGKDPVRPKRAGESTGKPRPEGTGPAPKPPPRRSLAVAESHDFEEQLTNGWHKQQLPAVYNLTSNILTVEYRVTGERFALQSEPVVRLPPVEESKGDQLRWLMENAPVVVFSPVQRGQYRGQLLARVRESGEAFAVTLFGRARSQHDPVGPSKTDGEKRREAAQRAQRDAEMSREKKIEDKRIADDRKRKDDAPRPWRDDWDKVVRKAQRAAEGIASAQRNAVTTIEGEALRYVRKIPARETPFWWVLVELGLNMATAGIAGSVAKGLLPRLLATREIIDVVPGFPVEFGIGKLSEFTTSAITEGIKFAGKKAIAESKPGGGSPSSAEGQQRPGGPLYSTNHEVEFFARQRAVLDRQLDFNAELIDERASAMRPLWRGKHPDLPIHMMEAIADELLAQKANAMHEQMRVSTALWLSALTQHRLGGEIAKDTAGNDVAAAKLEAAHDKGGRQVRDGLLDIMVAKHLPAPRVLSVRASGLSRATLDRVVSFPLRGYPLPIRVIANPQDHKPTVITRDEAGRVHVTGDEEWLAKIAARSSDSREHRGNNAAETGGLVVVDQILAIPLSAHGVTSDKIDHDDASPG